MSTPALFDVERRTAGEVAAHRDLGFYFEAGRVIVYSGRERLGYLPLPELSRLAGLLRQSLAERWDGKVAADLRRVEFTLYQIACVRRAELLKHAA